MTNSYVYACMKSKNGYRQGLRGVIHYLEILPNGVGKYHLHTDLLIHSDLDSSKTQSMSEI